MTDTIGRLHHGCPPSKPPRRPGGPLEHLVMCDSGDAEVLISNPAGTHDNIWPLVVEIFDGGVISIILGGDHATTWWSATTVADRYGHDKVGIVHFDAHAVTAPDMQGTLHGPGTPRRRLIENGAGAELRADRSAGLPIRPARPHMEGGAAVAELLRVRDPQGRRSRVCRLRCRFGTVSCRL